MLTRRAIAVIAALATGVLVTSCAADLPVSVDEGSTVTVGWTQQVTSFNAATTRGSTAGNREIASVTHDSFARLGDGEVILDEAFGTVEVTDPEPTSFTVRYDLADRTWSDGVPVDAADLLLAWAAGSNATAGEFDSLTTDLRRSTADVPAVDEFGRSIDVSFKAPVREWQTALDVAVPAHVVGEQALGIEDPMEAKQAVVDAITDGDEDDLAKIADTWNTGFDLGDDTDDLPAGLTVGNGTYLVRSIERSDSGVDHVVLEVNRAYDGKDAPVFETIDVVEADAPLRQFPDDIDVVQVGATPDDFRAVRDFERLDHHVATTQDGLLWVLALRADRGIFREADVRRAFLRASPRGDVEKAGAGEWDDAYSLSDSLLFQPGSPGYTIAGEDAGLRATFEGSATDPIDDRTGAGISAGTQVCVLYDTDDDFATGAFAALQAETAEIGWAVTDCGDPNVTKAMRARRDWQAVITTVPLPEDGSDILQVWGGKKKSRVTGAKSVERARLVASLAKTPDRYEATDLQVQIETGLVEEAVALPLALEPLITLSNRRLVLIEPPEGRSVTLLGDAGTWELED